MCNCIAERGPYVYCIAATTRERNSLGSCYHVATLPTHLFVCLILKPLFHAFKPRQTSHHQQQSFLESVPTDKTTNLSTNTLRSTTTTQAPSSSRQRRPTPRHVPSAPSAGSRNSAFDLGHLPDWPDESHNRHRRAIPPPPPPPQPWGETTLEHLRRATTSLLRSARRKREKVKQHLKRKMAREEESRE